MLKKFLVYVGGKYMYEERKPAGSWLKSQEEWLRIEKWRKREKQREDPEGAATS